MMTQRPLDSSRSIGLALLAGVMLALSFPRVGCWPLAWLGLVPLLFALRGRRLLGGLFYGWLVGAVTTGLAYSWVAGLLVRFAHLPLPLVIVGTVLNGLVHGAPMALTGALTCQLWRAGYRPMIALPLSLAAGELLVPTIFPWQLAVSQHEVLLLGQVADLIGVRGISTLVALGGAAIYELLTRPKDPATRRAVLVAAAVFAAVLTYGTVRFLQIQELRDSSPSLSVGLVQPNLSIEEKHDRGRQLINLALNQDLSSELERRGAELVVWPETSYPYYLRRGSPRDGTGHGAVRRGFAAPVIFGALSVDAERRRYNSAYLLDRAGALIGPADKNELLLFGEYIPFYDEVAFLRERFPDAWNFTPGQRPGVLVSGVLRAGVLNCYEDLLSDFARAVAAERPNLLVNITNDAWFGETAEPFQHAASASFRALEHRVDLVRAVNSGVSTAVASTGVTLTRTPIFVRRAELVEVRLQRAGTVYTLVGDLWSWVLTCGAVLLALLDLRRRRSS